MELMWWFFKPIEQIGEKDYLVSKITLQSVHISVEQWRRDHALDLNFFPLGHGKHAKYSFCGWGAVRPCKERGIN